MGVRGLKFGSASSRGEGRAHFMAEAAADVEEAFDLADLQPQVQPQPAGGLGWRSFEPGLSD